jgi:CRISPR-associated protein Csm3
MTPTAPAANPFALKSRLLIRGTIRFETAWRIGTGREGQTMSDLGVLLDPEGRPVLPGSSLKGKLRSTCETLAHALDLSACQLDSEASGKECSSDVAHYKTIREEYKETLKEMDTAARLAWIARNTCDVCKLFGSPVKAAKLRCADGRLVPESWPHVVQVRDGVVLDRDSHTAVDGLKYDYEVVPPGTAFGVDIHLEDPAPAEVALVGAALFEWSAGSSLGGFTSRGLGRFRLEDIKVFGVDFAGNRTEQIRYLTATKLEDKLTERGNWEAFFREKINRQIPEA